MATKKTDILEDFKQRSGQKRQYEEESVSSAGSSLSGQKDILEDFKQSKKDFRDSEKSSIHTKAGTVYLHKRHGRGEKEPEVRCPDSFPPKR